MQTKGNSIFKLVFSMGLLAFLLAMPGAYAGDEGKPDAGSVKDPRTFSSTTEAYCESSCCWASGENVRCSESGCYASGGGETAEYICPAS